MTGCDITEDGSLIVSSSRDSTVRLWDGSTYGQKATHRYKMHIYIKILINIESILELQMELDF